MFKNLRFGLLLCLLLALTASSRAQANLKFVVVSYNVENLFDNIHDEGKNDDEFLPTGKARWTTERLNLKLDRIAMEIRAMNDGRGPDIITMPELENLRVLRMLNAKLADLKYRPVFAEGPDVRGIDVGMLTRFPLARPVTIIPIRIPGDRPTRPVYDVVLQITPTVKFGILMNHWPARMSPPSFRCAAGHTLRQVFQAHLMKDPDIDYIATGDLNDEPEDPSITTCLGTGTPQQVMSSTPLDPKFFDLYNEKNLSRDARGTYYYDRRNEWNALDHIVLSRGLFDNKNVRYIPGSFTNLRNYGINVYKQDVRVTQPNGSSFVVAAGSPVLFNTVGPEGRLKAFGVSDHLPVRADFEVVTRN